MNYSVRQLISTDFVSTLRPRMNVHPNFAKCSSTYSDPDIPQRYCRHCLKVRFRPIKPRAGLLMAIIFGDSDVAIHPFGESRRAGSEPLWIAEYPFAARMPADGRSGIDYIAD